MTRYEQGFMRKCAELLSSTASRKLILKQRIKVACSLLEKNASWGSRVVGKALRAIARLGREAGANPNFGERLGNQLIDTGFRGTIASGARRYWNNLSGAAEKRFTGQFGNNADEMVAHGRKSLKNVEDGVRKSGGKFNAEGLAKEDAAIAKRVAEENTARSRRRLEDLDTLNGPEARNTHLEATKDTYIPQREFDAVMRQAARLRGVTNRTRIGTGIAGLGLIGAGGIYGASRTNRDQPYYRSQYGRYSYGPRYYV